MNVGMQHAVLIRAQEFRRGKQNQAACTESPERSRVSFRNASSNHARACGQNREAYVEDVGGKAGVQAMIRPGEDQNLQSDTEQGGPQ